jgi:hypothetical protein
MYENQESQVKVFLKRIWPFINRLLNIIFYSLLNFIKSSVRFAIEQLKGI